MRIIGMRGERRVPPNGLSHFNVNLKVMVMMKVMMMSAAVLPPRLLAAVYMSLLVFVFPACLPRLILQPGGLSGRYHDALHVIVEENTGTRSEPRHTGCVRCSLCDVVLTVTP